ncbi:MAG: thiol peroxidase [Coriobacteriales bacterium]|jgi:thiol peroxidase|nr:thiol peroxidase [Coriobacteriales bacterium]
MMTVTFGGERLTLAGEQLKVGDVLPTVTAFDNNMLAFNTSETNGSRVFLTVPSLDTPVCDLEVRTFNERAAELSGVSIYCLSVDLPFAQARWCGSAGIESVKVLSDYNGAEFGRATGTFIKELALLTRAVFVVDAANQVVYTEYVSEITEQPDYDAALLAVKKIAG